MYDFHHGYIRNNDDKARLLFTDRDILVYEIKTHDMNKYFYKNKEMFKFSKNL